MDTTIQGNMNNTEDIVVSYTPDTLEDDLRNMDKRFNDSSSIRQQLISKLVPIALKMELDTEGVTDRETALALDSKLNVINSLNNLLNDEDKAIKTKIDIKTKQKELIENGKQAEAFVTALNELSRLKVESIQSSMNVADDTLDQRVSSENITVNEAELRDDPTDLR